MKNPSGVDSAFVVNAQIPYNAKIFVYDSMDKLDQMKIFRGGSILRTQVYNNGVTAPEYLKEEALKAKELGAEMVGQQFSNRFTPTWKTERYTLYYYDGWDEDWVNAAYLATQYQWKSAADIWMKKVNDNNATKRACACYNTALAFYMMGDQNLAAKWLDRADSTSLEYSPELRQRINARK